VSELKELLNNTEHDCVRLRAQRDERERSFEARSDARARAFTVRMNELGVAYAAAVTRTVSLSATVAALQAELGGGGGVDDGDEATKEKRNGNDEKSMKGNSRGGGGGGGDKGAVAHQMRKTAAALLVEHNAAAAAAAKEMSELKAAAAATATEPRAAVLMRRYRRRISLLAAEVRRLTPEGTDIPEHLAVDAAAAAEGAGDDEDDESLKEQVAAAEEAMTELASELDAVAAREDEMSAKNARLLRLSNEAAAQNAKMAAGRIKDKQAQTLLRSQLQLLDGKVRAADARVRDESARAGDAEATAARTREKALASSGDEKEKTALHKTVVSLRSAERAAKTEVAQLRESVAQRDAWMETMKKNLDQSRKAADAATARASKAEAASKQLKLKRNKSMMKSSSSAASLLATVDGAAGVELAALKR
jgi:hypothetical protein